MKTKDIEVGKDYAREQWTDHYERITVLEIERGRTIAYSHPFTRAKREERTQKTIKVSSEGRQDRWIRPQDVRMPWDVAEGLMATARQSREAVDERRGRDLSTSLDLIAALERAGLHAWRVQGIRSDGIKIEFSTDAANSLIEILEGLKK